MLMPWCSTFMNHHLLAFYMHSWMIKLAAAMAQTWTHLMRMVIYWTIYPQSLCFTLPLPHSMCWVILLAYMACVASVFDQLHHGKALAHIVTVYLWWRIKIKRGSRVWVLCALSYSFLSCMRVMNTHLPFWSGSRRLGGCLISRLAYGWWSQKKIIMGLDWLLLYIWIYLARCPCNPCLWEGLSSC